MEQNEEKDYARLIAAQNESARRLKIKSINNTLKEENKKKVGSAIAAGVLTVGVLVATHFSGIDPEKAIALEVQSLNSMDALKEYFGLITPAMWGTMITAATSYCSYFRHSKKYKQANQEFYDMMDNKPEDYQDIVEGQAKNK